MKAIRVIDSHTCGEPTRVVIDGGPDLGAGSIAERLSVFRERFDEYRRAIVQEPRGSEILVGALLCPPSDGVSAAGVIFFNNVGYLGMCGHGAIGVVATLAHLGRVEPGEHRLETPAGIVTATLHADRSVSIENVPSYREAHHVAIEVPDHGTISGDVAYGGNWFFLSEVDGQSLASQQAEELVEFAWRVRRAVNVQGFPQVDHVELFGEPTDEKNDCRNFVLCPGKAYDRSPCGTGTSAKLACLAADGKLAAGATWIQEGILGTSFHASYRWEDRTKGVIVPTITGQAFITAEATLLLDENDPFGWGIYFPVSRPDAQRHG